MHCNVAGLKFKFKKPFANLKNGISKRLVTVFAFDIRLFNRHISNVFRIFTSHPPHPNGIGGLTSNEDQVKNRMQSAPKVIRKYIRLYFQCEVKFSLQTVGYRNLTRNRCAERHKFHHFMGGGSEKTLHEKENNFDELLNLLHIINYAHSMMNCI